MAPRDKKGILFILRAVVQSYLSVLCVHSRLTSVLLRFNSDNKFQRGGGTESYVHEQTLENRSRQLPESALLSRAPQEPVIFFLFSEPVNLEDWQFHRKRAPRRALSSWLQQQQAARCPAHTQVPAPPAGKLLYVWKAVLM